jgi:hypothetical protein
MTITLEPDDYDRLRLVAAALNKSEADTVGHLLDRLNGGRTSTRAAPSGGPEPIHVRYKGHRVDGTYDRRTKEVTITSGPLAGTTYKRPSPAARAVIQELAPGISAERNGWSFWIVTATGEPVQSIR